MTFEVGGEGVGAGGDEGEVVGAVGSGGALEGGGGGGEGDGDVGDGLVGAFEEELRLVFGGVAVEAATFGFSEELADEGEVGVVAGDELGVAAAGRCQEAAGFVAAGEDEVGCALFKEVAAVGFDLGVQHDVLAVDAAVAFEDFKAGDLGSVEGVVPVGGAVFAGEPGPPDAGDVLPGARVGLDGAAEEDGFAASVVA